MSILSFLPKKKTRTEIISEKSEQVLNDILISGFSNNEISIILDTLTKEGKSVLQNRKIVLENELISTNNAINRL